MACRHAPVESLVMDCTDGQLIGLTEVAVSWMAIQPTSYAPEIHLSEGDQQSRSLATLHGASLVGPCGHAAQSAGSL